MITNTVMHASPNHGFPMFSNLDDFDTWPEDQAELYIDVVVAVVKAGFKGVKADTAESNSKSIILIFTDQESPEGRVVQNVHELAKSGLLRMSVQEVLDIIYQAYREQGLTL